MEDEEKSFTDRVYEQVEQYAKTSIELYKLKAINTFSGVFAAVGTGLVLWVIFFFILLFLSIGLAFYLGDVFGGWHYGFFTVAAVYALAGVVIFVFRVKCLKERLHNYIIKQFFKD